MMLLSDYVPLDADAMVKSSLRALFGDRSKDFILHITRIQIPI
jgi:hypothetical protein